MATQGERRALMFLVAVALLGAGTRAWRAQRKPIDNAAVHSQLQAVDSVARSTDRRIARSPRRKAPAEHPPIRHSVDPIDLDTAPAEEIERLPGIGPGLAKRIVSDRNANGPFGCLAALDRVKGIGPALLARLDSLATFSQAGGPVCVSAEAGGESREQRPAEWRGR